MSQFKWVICTTVAESRVTRTIRPFGKNDNHMPVLYMDGTADQPLTLQNLINEKNVSWAVVIPSPVYFDDFLNLVTVGDRLRVVVITAIADIGERKHDYVLGGCDMIDLGNNETSWWFALVEKRRQKELIERLMQHVDYNAMGTFSYWVASIRTLPFIGERLIMSKVRPPFNSVVRDVFWDTVSQMDIVTKYEELVILNRTGVPDHLVTSVVWAAIEKDAFILEFDEHHESFEITKHRTADILNTSSYHTLPDAAGPVKQDFKFTLGAGPMLKLLKANLEKKDETI